MAALQTIKMSSKGQVVIPQGIREELGLREGTVFAVLGSRDAVVLKRLDTPSKEAIIAELEALAREGRRRLEQQGVKESDIPKILRKTRK